MNCSAGAAAIDLRGLMGQTLWYYINASLDERFDLNVIVDTNAIPVSLINRADLMTGASVVGGAMPFQGSI